ncbi:MAG: ABC transporter permease subunit [Candidatus Berkelbacteria bacterium]|nr:ABC transporter permease subunit [Candidatus Berkelbacteria bacterium]
MKERKWPMLIYSMSSILLLLLYVALYPSMASQSQQLAEVMKSMPEALMKALGSSAAQLTNFSLEALLASKQFSVVFQALAAIFAISIAANDLAGEIETGTIEFLLSQPISRTKLYFSRFFSGSLLLIIFCILSTVTVIPIAKLFHVDYSAVVYWRLLFVSVLYSLAIYSFSYVLSAIFSVKGRVTGIAGGIITLMYVVFIISSLKESLDKLKYLSFFHYFSADVLYTGVDKLGVWIFIAIIIICTTAGALVFNQRDIST